MRRKTTLSLMELAIMVAVFALAAAICLRAFVWADVNSRRSEAESRAMAYAQTLAEQLKNTHGDFAAVKNEFQDFFIVQDGDSLTQRFTRDMAPVGMASLLDSRTQNAATMRYALYAARVDAGVPGLGKAEIRFRDEERDEELFSFAVAWQEEVTGDA